MSSEVHFVLVTMANEDREDLKKMARELQQQLLPIIKALRKHHINVNISKITGTTTSIVGGSK